MTDADTDTSAPDQQPTGGTEASKPENKEESTKQNGDKGRDDKKTDGKKTDGKKTDGKKTDGKPDDKKDEEQERREQFAAAGGDPLADALGGPSARAGEGQAYRSWMRTIRASGAAAFVGGGTIGVLNITAAGDTYSRRGQAPGPVRDEDITDLVNRYAPVADFAAFVRRLASERLLVLRGAPGTGRTTTGLRLLAKLANGVARFSPDTDLGTLAEADLAEQSGYLMELNPGSGSLPPTPAEVDGLRDHLTACNCYLVLIAPHDIRYRDVFAASIADCPLPDPGEVFDQAIDYEIHRLPGQEQALRVAATTVRPHGGTGPRTPAEIQWLVAHLISTLTTDYTAADLDILNSDLATRYVSAWFEPLAGLPTTSDGDEAVRLAAFRIALAVLYQSPFDMVADAAEALTRRILVARSPRRTPGRPVFAHNREDYVANSRASVAPGAVRYGTATVPTSLVAYDDDRLPLAVLRHVWAVHNLRAPLLSWLESLTRDPRPPVHMRAALAIGLLTSWDFSYTFHQRIEPWARSKNPGRRWAVAVALDEASRNDDVRPVVREVLEVWREKGSFAQRWTSAMALGFDLSLRDPANALTELRKLGRWEDGRLAEVASWAVARMFLLGAIKPVIKALGDWLDDDRQDVRWLGLLAVYRITNATVQDLEHEFELTDTSAGGRWTRLANRRRWPLLVALADEDPGLLDPLADLVWQLARSALAEEVTAAALKRWMRAGKKDPTCLGPVGRFLALLGDDDSDRARLLHLLRTLRRDRDEPLPAPVADRLERAIEFNVHIADQRGER